MSKIDRWLQEQARESQKTKEEPVEPETDPAESVKPDQSNREFSETATRGIVGIC